MQLYTLDDLPPVDGAAVFVRVDFNVPLADGEVLDVTRLEAALPTVRHLAEAGGRLLLASHCGRPKGRHHPRDSLRPVARKLSQLLDRPVPFAEDCVGEAARTAAAGLAPGGICLLENLRFHPGEAANDPGFAAELASLAELYVDDAFGSVHRAHASVVGVPERFAHKAAGRLLVKEVEALGKLFGEPQRPFVALLGGAKIEGKIDTLESLVERVDTLLVGGAMANTFLAAQGHELGASLVERERFELALKILARVGERRVELLLPVDLIVTDEVEKAGRAETVKVGKVPSQTQAVDLGPDSRRLFCQALAGAGTLFWNGPMGVFERPPFDQGSRAIAEAVAACPGFTVVGGGETLAVVRQSGVAGRIDHVSTGGGASLEFLAGKRLPGIAALERTG